MIIIVGCSFSLGWYSWADNDEIVNKDYCWYDELDRPYRAYAHPGGGLMSYCKCLDIVSNPAPKNASAGQFQHGRTPPIENASAILIQETFSPRIIVHDQFEYRQHRENVYGWRLNHIFSNTIAGLPKVQNDVSEKYKFDWQSGMSSWMADLNAKSDGWEYLNTACSSHLDRVAESTGLPVYSYSFTGKKYPYKYIKYLDVPPATQKLFWDDRYHHYNDKSDPLHFNKVGNKLLGKMIKKGLDNELS